MFKHLIALSCLLLTIICAISADNGKAKTIADLERQISGLETQLENKDELISMLRIKTISEQEKIVELEKKLSELMSQNNKCQFSSCLCKSTDLHDLKLPGSESFQVSCDSTLAGPGWTVILRRVNGNVNFDRNWLEYQRGFGDLRGEFFIGLDKLHTITKSQPYELYIHLENFNNETRYATYDSFAVANDDGSFEITSLGAYSGNAGDAMVHHKNMKFSTSDQDNDNSNRNCADQNSSGWWFNNCFHCNLNGPYNGGFYWYPWQKNVLKFAQVMIRPKVQ